MGTVGNLWVKNTFNHTDIKLRFIALIIPHIPLKIKAFVNRTGGWNNENRAKIYSTLSFVGKTLNFVVICIIMNIYFLNRGVRLCLYQKE